jgi:hypothetical protein
MSNAVTERWGLLSFTVDNLSDQDRQARVLLGYTGSPDVQYGRDVWVPARSNLKTWMQVGPAPAEGPSNGREIRCLLQERTTGQEQFIRSRDRELTQTQLVSWHKREPATAIMLDEVEPLSQVLGELPRPDSPNDEAYRLAKVFRAARNLSSEVTRCPDGPLSPVPDGLDGADHIILASARIASDPAGMRSLRQWVQRGGSLWVMLDRVSPENIALLLGDALDFQVVDHASLTHFAIEVLPPTWQRQQRGAQSRPGDLKLPAPDAAFRPNPFERPVEFVRVMLPEGEHARHMIDGWPVWFTRHVGRGRVVFTTLGSRGWHRKREGSDPKSPYEIFPYLPVPSPVLEAVADVLQPIRREAFRIESLDNGLADEIGYTTVHRSTAASVFAAFLLTTLALAVVLRRFGRPELVGWIGPAAALVATGAFVALGEASRRSATPTIAVAQVVEGDSATQDASVRGRMAVYRPYAGSFSLEAERGGIIEVPSKDVKGQMMRWVATDLDCWHLENLDLPFGVRLSDFRFTLATDQPISAVARFGPEGVEGNLTTGPLRGLSDALIDGPGDRRLALRLAEDGSFRAGSADLLPQGEFIAGTFLSDRQQRRGEIYREYLKRPPAGRAEERALLLAWADPIDMRFQLVQPASLAATADVRKAGSALVVLPLRMELPRPGSRVTIPGPFVRHRRIFQAGVSGSTTESDSADMHLRFQLPSAALPFKVERARLTLRVDAPGRRVIIAGWEGAEAGSGRVREIRRVDSPLDSIRIDLSGESLLRLDEDGGLHLNIHISELLKAQSGLAAGGSEKWKIHYLDLEITGRME